MRWYHELCIYAACGVLTASAMKGLSVKGMEKGEWLAVAVFWPLFALLLIIVLTIKIFDKKRGEE